MQEADVILHVRDIAADESAAEAADVRKVLEQLGIDEHSDRLIEVWNKLDLLDEEARTVVLARARRSEEGPGPIAAPVSAVAGEGIEGLLHRIAERVDDADPLELTLRADDGEFLAWLYRNGRVVSRRDGEEGTMALTVRLDAQALGRMERLFPRTQLELAAE